MAYLVDTNVISELCRSDPDQGVLTWADGITQLSVSVITVEEVFFGLSWCPNQRLLKRMEQFFESHEVLPISQNCCVLPSIRGEHWLFDGFHVASRAILGGLHHEYSPMPYST